tara:strand:+ start:51 stop:1112 length:1062 start_codon:yes stop_codon:yes gene_type:complete
MARRTSTTSLGIARTQPERPREVIVPVEVLEVMLSEAHPEFKNNLSLMVGSIKGRRYDTERGNSVESLQWYNPLDPSDLKIPLIGEAVLLVEAPDKGIISRKISRSFCYISTIGLFGDISNNAAPGFVKSKDPNSSPTLFTGNMGTSEEPSIGDYAPDLQIPPLVAFEGDRIIQGRWGNAIRFSNTSNGSVDKTFWNSSGPDGDPIVIISNGLEDSETLTRTEDLDDGSSNLILTSTQQIDIEASNKLPIGYSKLNQYVGSQIVLSSDKIVLNSMEDTVVISGKKGVSISTPEWKADITKLCDILEDLISEVSTIAQGTAVTTNPLGGPLVTPFVTVIPKLATITTKLNALKQ